MSENISEVFNIFNRCPPKDGISKESVESKIKEFTDNYAEEIQLDNKSLIAMRRCSELRRQVVTDEEYKIIISCLERMHMAINALNEPTIQERKMANVYESVCSGRVINVALNPETGEEIEEENQEQVEL